MPKFPKDVRKADVLRAVRRLGFNVVREREHIYLERTNSNGTRTPMVLPNHLNINSFTLRAILTQSKVSREDFLKALESR